MTQADTFFSLQTAVAGRYSLVRELGRGGMGVVYLARDVALDRPVAIKLLPPTLAEDAALRERFLREARTVAQLSHPNIVPIHAVEERDGLVFFVMSYIDGVTLGERVRKNGPLSPTDATRIMREVAWALGHAHARGVVHRDVKPDNVLLDAESGRAIVTDFGIAATNVNANTSDATLGTPQYLSPEQARGESVEARSDLYSLGATMWFALTGAPPFAGTLPQLLHRHATSAAPSLTSVRAHMPTPLAHAVDACLAKSLDNRPQSADALASALNQSSEPGTLPVPMRRYLDAVSGTEVQMYGVVGSVLAAAGIALNLLPVPPNVLFNPNSILATIAAFGSVAAFVVSGTLVAWRTHHVRELTRAGFDYRAMQRAITNERRRLAAEGALEPPRRQAMIGVAGAATAIATGALAFNAPSFEPGFVWSTACAAAVLLTARSVTNAIVSRGPGVKGAGFRAIERWMFRRFGVKSAPRAIADGEATVVALGGAIQDLWNALPDAARAALNEVPQIAERLESEAVALRARIAEPQVAARLQTVVAAMESLRLDLLRVQAGVMEPTALTAQVEAAKQVGEHVDAMIEARDEVRALLKSETPRVLT